MEPKAKTIAERFGFRDPELSTPRHDEIMIWLTENLEAVARAARFPELDKWGVECNPRQVVDSEWEYTVSDGNYIIGFIDMKARVVCEFPERKRSLHVFFRSETDHTISRRVGQANSDVPKVYGRDQRS